jgi:7,8-dihydropterin-6-yl-methyl-4-(beta-D-ribofuranosyl)aminobenzene 5'-phosphate synthase
MTITTLVENTATSPNLASEHGLSLYIESDQKTILFDTGASSRFAKNAQELSIDLNKVDLAVLSHGHWDHGGGIATFFELNAHAPLYLKEGALGPHYSLREDGIYHWAGLDTALKESKRLHFTDTEEVITDRIRLFSVVEDRWGLPKGNKTLFTKDEDGYTPDDFSHEQYLAIDAPGVRLLVSGCSHRGIINIVEEYRSRYSHYPTVVVGGMHLYTHPGGDEELTRIAEHLVRTGAVYHTGHCTGFASFEALKRIMGDQIHYLGGGETLTL